MCKYSALTKKTVDARPGQTLEIGTVDSSDVGGQRKFGMFHEKGTPATACAVCVKDKTIITLTNIPADVQAEHRIGSQEVATLIDRNDRVQDMMFFHSTQIEEPLLAFADRGIQAYVGELRQREARVSRTQLREAERA